MTSISTNRQNSHLPSWRMNFFDDLTQLVELKGKKVLEIGCGDGEIAKLVARASEPQFVYAIDPYSYEIYPFYEERNLLCLPMSAENLLFPNNYFDVVFSHNVFEHLLNLPQVWQEIKRVIKPGGVFYTHFAPLWTHAYGHHFYEEDEQSFSCVFPPYAHLYLSEQEIIELINQNILSLEEKDRAKRFILGDVCNKFFPSDYREILSTDEEFKVEEYQENYQHHHNRAVPEEVFSKYSFVTKEDFEISGITLKGTKLVATESSQEEMKEVYLAYAMKDIKPSSFLKRALKKLKSKIVKI